MTPQHNLIIVPGVLAGGKQWAWCPQSGPSCRPQQAIHHPCTSNCNAQSIPGRLQLLAQKWDILFTFCYDCSKSSTSFVLSLQFRMTHQSVSSQASASLAAAQKLIPVRIGSAHCANSASQKVLNLKTQYTLLAATLHFFRWSLIYHPCIQGGSFHNRPLSSLPIRQIQRHEISQKAQWHENEAVVPTHVHARQGFLWRNMTTVCLFVGFHFYSPSLSYCE